MSEDRGYSVPHWHDAARATETNTPLLIIGAGVTGLAAALAAERRGVTPLVIDASPAPIGASHRNAGFLMRGAAESYVVAIRAWGRDRARTLWRWSEENLARLRAMGIDQEPSYRAIPSCLLALDEGERAELEASVELLAEDGFETALVRPGDPGADDHAWQRLNPLIGLLNPGDASVNPTDLVSTLRSRLARSVVECAPIDELRIVDGTAVAISMRRRIIAERALLCVNAFVGELAPSLASVVTPNRGQMLAVEAPGLRLEASYYANRGSEYFRLTRDGVLVVGGCRAPHDALERTTSLETAPQVQDDIERFTERLLGGPVRPLRRWAGTMGFSHDGMPLIGPIDPAGATWFCGGYTGHGMSLGVRCAEAAIEAMYDGAETPFPLARAIGDDAL